MISSRRTSANPKTVQQKSDGENEVVGSVNKTAFYVLAIWMKDKWLNAADHG